MENLSVSFVNRAFVMTRLRVEGRKGTPCEGKLITEIGEVAGNFSLRHRRLTALKVKGLQLKPLALSRECFVRKGEKTDFRLGDVAMPEGLKVSLEGVKVAVPEFGELGLNSEIKLTDSVPGVFSIETERARVSHQNLHAELTGAKADFLREAGSLVLSAANLRLSLKVSDLAKFNRLRTKKFSVLAGDAELKAVAEVRAGLWKIDSSVALRKIRVKGEPFFTMPMGLMQLSPENMWPMAEDAPGILEFSVKTEAYTHQLPKAIPQDMRKALTKKIRGNLKKKLPVLPF